MDDQNRTEDILWTNEIEANRILVVTGAITAALFAIIWPLSELGVFYVYFWGRSPVTYILVISVLVISILVCRHYDYSRKWVKFLLMGAMILACAVADAVFTYNVVILMVIPTVLSVRYFSRRYTAVIALVSLGVFFLSTMWGALYGEPNLNVLELAPGTVIELGEETWIIDVLEAQNMPYDKMHYMRNTLFYGYLVETMQGLIVFTACITMAGHGRKLIYRQRELTQHRARIDTELILAAQIQTDMLPTQFPTFPDQDEFDVYAEMTPCREVGGDFYDFFLIDDDRLGLLIADVSGKGIPAAMFMMYTKNIIVNNAMMGKTPSKVLEDANAAICANNSEGMFVTVWFGVLTLSTGCLTAANAGHEYPVFIHRRETPELVKDRHGFILGVRAGKTYTDQEYTLKPGEMLFVYTDGIVEAMDSGGELFGRERMLDAIKGVSNDTPQEILRAVRSAVDSFAGSEEQFDDLTMLCLKYNGNSGKGPDNGL